MKRKITLLLLTLALVLSGCGSAGGSPVETHTVTDHLGHAVEVPVEVRRIAVCDIVPLPSVISVFFDSAEKIVAMSPVSMSAAENSLLSQLYPEVLEAQTGWITGNQVNVEELMLLQPDVVFYNAASADLGQKLRNAGFPALAVSVNKWEYDAIETLNQWISLLEQVFPGSDRAGAVKEYSSQVLELVQSRTADLSPEERLGAFFLYKYDETTLLTSGARFFGQYWAEAAGMENAASELTADNQAAVNMEQVLAWNPDIIFITNFTAAQPEDILGSAIGNDDWSPIAAVQQGRVYKMPLGLYRSFTPGADTPVTLLWLAKTAYPELFRDIDITQEAIRYYREAFGITLTEAQAELIFAPTSAAAGGY